MTQDSGQPAALPSGGAVPDPPRPVTPRVRRRTWAEPMVRGWLLLAIGLVIGALVLAVSSTIEWISETNVVRNGVTVQAVAWHAGGARVTGMSLAVGSPVNIEYEYNGQKYKVTGLLYNTGKMYISQVPFEIRIDPENPTTWTNRTVVPPMVEKMMGAGIMLGVAAACAIVALVLRSRSMAIWVDGDLISSRVIGQGQSALAPQSAALRCTVRIGRTERPLTVYVPHQQASDQQTIELIVSHDRSQALAVVNYHP
jgi:hypothetical protein